METTQDTPTPPPRRNGRFAALAASLALAVLLQACGSVGAPGTALDAGQRPGLQARTHSGGHPTAAQYDIVGIASWYGKPYHGRRTASGEIFNMHQMTAAHPSLPFGTRVVVTNLENGRAVTVKINDRGPFVPGRVIDVSRQAAGQLGFLGRGLTRVGVRIIASSRG